MTGANQTHPSRDESPKYRAVLLLNTEDRPTKVVGIDGDNILLRCESSVDLEPRARLRFERLGGKDRPEIHAMLELKSMLAEEDGHHVTLRFIALFSTAGHDILHQFLTDGMGLDSDDCGRFSDRPNGTYFVFGSRQGAAIADAPAKPKPPPPPPAPSRAPGPQRSAPRVTVRVPVHFSGGDTRRDGMAYNISDTGLYIATQEQVPSVGDTLKVLYPIRRPRRDILITLTGRVCWSMPGMTSSRGGGFGLEIITVSDDENGELWQSHVRNELDFGLQVT
jgi:Tfp pilus assembly protein PilZ